MLFSYQGATQRRVNSLLRRCSSQSLQKYSKRRVQYWRDNTRSLCQWPSVNTIYLFFLWRYSPNFGLGLPPWNSPFHFGLLDLRQSVGLFTRAISSLQDLYLYTNTEKCTNTKHPCHEWVSNPRSRLPSERIQRIVRVPWPAQYIILHIK
jgi:hypothetical protein